MKQNSSIQRLPESGGDKTKKVCEHYATCSSFETQWEDETGAQLFCPICGAATWVDYTEDNKKE